MRKNITRALLFSTPILFILLLSSCSPQQAALETNPPTQPPPTSTIFSTPTKVDINKFWWYKERGIKWIPKGDPYESENFIVYSDYADMDTKERFANESELALVKVLSVIGALEEMEGISLLKPKMEVFIRDVQFAKVPWHGFAHFKGYLAVYEPEYYRNAILQYPDYFPYKYLITHEIYHVISYRIIRNYYIEPHLCPQTWFEEGLATYFGIPMLPIRTLAIYEMFMRDVAHFAENGNPISFRNPSYIPIDYPYELWELAVHYLIETYGMDSVIGVLVDMREGIPFEQGFENRIGMTVDEYQENFDTLMRDFLAEE